MAGARIMNGATDRGTVRETRRAVMAAVAMVCLCVPAASLIAQHQNNPHPAAPSHSAAPQQQSRPQSTHPQSPQQQYQNQRGNAPQYQNRAPQQQYQNRPAPQQYPAYRRRPNTAPASDAESIHSAGGCARRLPEFELQHLRSTAVSGYCQADLCASGPSWRVAQHPSQCSGAATGADVAQRSELPSIAAGRAAARDEPAQPGEPVARRSTRAAPGTSREP